MTVPATVAKEFALVLAGVAAGAVFLPELSSNLWTMRAEEIRQTVPDVRVQELRRELVAAGTSHRGRNEFVWAQVLEPLLKIVNEPLAVQWNPTYDVHLYMNRPISVDSGTVEMHSLQTTSRSERILPSREGARIWVSMARTSQALMSEFGKMGCLLRELVELPGVPIEAWRTEVENNCIISITVDGQPLTLETPEGENADIFRWEALVPHPEGTSLDEPVPLMVSVQFPVTSDIVTFPMIFASYFCVGRTEVSFTAYHPDPNMAVAVDFENFLSRAPGGAPVGELTRRTPEGSNLCGFNFSTRRNAVLWPGSGVLFKWEVEQVS